MSLGGKAEIAEVAGGNPTTSSESGGAPVYVRECYTAYVCNFYSTHTDGFETSSGYSTGLVDKTVSAAERARQVAAAQRAAKIAEERAAAAAREAAQDEREQKNSWLDSAGNWWNENKSGIGTGLGIASMVLGVAALIPTPLSGVFAGLSIATGVASAAIDCSDGVDLSCGVSAAGAVAGLGGLAAKGTRLIKPVDDALRLSDDSIKNADTVGTGLATAYGSAGLAGTAIDSRWKVRGW